MQESPSALIEKIAEGLTKWPFENWNFGDSVGFEALLIASKVTGNPRWEEFANDRENHVPACSSVNRSKGSSGPEDFYRKATDGKGRDYIIVRFEEYLELYYYILDKYGLEKEPFDRSSLFMSSRR